MTTSWKTFCQKLKSSKRPKSAFCQKLTYKKCVGQNPTSDFAFCQSTSFWSIKIQPTKSIKSLHKNSVKSRFGICITVEKLSVLVTSIRICVFFTQMFPKYFYCEANELQSNTCLIGFLSFTPNPLISTT